MNEGTNKAVFLSYASQDAEAAKRIADALRAAGVEVWFDQSELRGGDSWDVKIRTQIKECALFVPVITPNTNARVEGYFRLEWKLAVDRSHLMADDAPFLFPVVMGDVTDATARVPDKFREVQWTRLRLDETPGELAGRVAKLLAPDQETGSAGPVAPGRSGRSPAKRQPGWLRYAWAVVGLISALVYAVRPLFQPDHRVTPKPAKVVPLAPAAASEARKLAQQAMTLLEDPNSAREAMILADELCQRALALDAGDAEVWAAASFTSHYLFIFNHDRSMARWEKARSQATRANQLDPQSISAALALVSSQTGQDNDEERLRTKRELHRRFPGDPHVIFALLNSEGLLGDEAAIQKLLGEMRALPRTGWQARALDVESDRLRRLGRFAEAEAIVEEMFAWSGDLRPAYHNKLLLLMRGWRDLAEAEPYIEKIPARYRQEPAFAAEIAQYWLWRAQADKSVEALVLVVPDYLEELHTTTPKGYLTGWAHAVAGRTVAAQAEWRKALAVVDERLKTDGRRFSLLGQRAVLLALTGQDQEARSAWQLRQELARGAPPRGIGAEAEVYAVLKESEPAITAIERGWAELSVGLRAWSLPHLRYHPAFASIRGDPRVQRILAEGAAMLEKLKAQQTGGAKSGGATSPPVAAPAKTDDKSIAVLAFANMSPDPDNAFFSDGVHEDVITQLAKVRDLRVISRTSVLAFRDSKKPLKEIAGVLGVAHILEGSVRRTGNRVRITAQLIDAATDEHLWAETYDRNLDDIFAIQGEIAEKIAAALKTALSPDEAQALARKPTENTDAYDLYLRARGIAISEVEGTGEWERRVALLEKAVALDPNFAQAWAELAAANAFIEFGRERGGYMIGEGALERAKEAMTTALRLAPDDPEVIGNHGTYLFYGFDDYAGAMAQYQRRAVLQPNSSAVFHALSMLQRRMGRWADSLANARRACQLDPGNIGYLQNLKLLLDFSRRNSEQIEVQKRIATLLPDKIEERLHLATLHINAHGSFREGEEFFRNLPRDKFESPAVIEMRKNWAQRSGNLKEAIRLDRLQPYFDGNGTPRWVQALWMAHTYFLLGDKAGAEARLGEYQAEIRKLAETQHDNIVALMSLATMERILGHPEEARRLAKKAAALDAENGDAISHTIWQGRLAAELDFTGDLEGALAVYQQQLSVPSMVGGAAGLRTEKFFVSPALQQDPRFQALLDDPKNSAPLF